MGTTDKEHGIVSTKKSKPKPKKKSSGTSKLRQWINSQLEAKGLSASAAKKDAGKYKTISAAKKAGSLYYTNPKGVIMIAAFASDLDNIPTKKKKPTDSKKVGKQRYDMRRSAERAADAKRMIKINEPKGGGQSAKAKKSTLTSSTLTTVTDSQKARVGSLSGSMETLSQIRSLLPELERYLSEKDMKAIKNILSGKVPMSDESKINQIKRRVKKSGAMNMGGLTQSAMQNGLSRKINPTTGLTMNKGGMMDYRKKGMFYGGGMTRRGR